MWWLQATEMALLIALHVFFLAFSLFGRITEKRLRKANRNETASRQDLVIFREGKVVSKSQGDSKKSSQPKAS